MRIINARMGAMCKSTCSIRMHQKNLQTLALTVICFVKPRSGELICRKRWNYDSPSCCGRKRVAVGKKKIGKLLKTITVVLKHAVLSVMV